MPPRPHPLPFAATQPAAGADGPASSEHAATEPEGRARDDIDVASDLVRRIVRFTARRRNHPEAAQDAIVVGKYFLVDMIDEGAMGIVCTALEPNFGTVALKFPKASPGPQLRARVLQEGKLLARVHHTHVLRVYEVGECEDTVFIATEYVDGHSLRTWQVGRPWPTVVRAYLDAARGLAAIHAAGIVHQDIKPDNIRIDARGVVRVLDFGLAHLESRLHEFAATQSDIHRDHATFYRGGTPGYMAPEQLHPGETADARADQFAFCAALWEALYGVVPFPSDPGATALGRPRTLTAVGPRWLRKLLQRGLSEHRADRFPNMTALVDAIHHRLQRRWWPAIAIAAAAATTAAVITARMSGPSLPMCEHHGFTDLWSPTHEQALVVAASAARDPSAVPVIDSLRAELTAYTRRGAEAHARMCLQAHDAGSRTLAEAREPCFADRRRAVAHVVDAAQQFAIHHAADARAPWAEQRTRWLNSLDPIDDCLAPRPAFTHATTTLDTTLDVALVAALAGDTTTARTHFDTLLADPSADPWHRARAHLGRVEHTPVDDAPAELLLALRDAEASGDVLLAADVLARLVFILGDTDPDPTRALDLVPPALGKLTALGLDHNTRARDLHLSAALAAIQAGRLELADDHLVHAASIHDTVDPREYLVRAQLAHQRGDLPTALAHADAALALQQRDFGPGTRPVADTLRTLGTLQLAAADPTAEASLQASLRIFDDRLGPTSPDARTVHLTLAKLHYLHDDLVLARAHIAAVPPVSGLPAPWRPMAELLLGHLAEDPARAADHYRSALALLTARDVHPTLAHDHWLARLGLAQAALAQGHAAAAREALAPVLAALDGEAATYREVTLEIAAKIPDPL